MDEQNEQMEDIGVPRPPGAPYRTPFQRMAEKVVEWSKMAEWFPRLNPQWCNVMGHVPP